MQALAFTYHTTKSYQTTSIRYLPHKLIKVTHYISPPRPSVHPYPLLVPPSPIPHSTTKGKSHPVNISRTISSSPRWSLRVCGCECVSLSIYSLKARERVRILTWDPLLVDGLGCVTKMDLKYLIFFSRNIMF